jgi:hypothetical protein
MRGYVYCLSNPAMPGLLKIGFTDRPIVNRLKELSAATGVPEAFEVEFCVRVRNASDLERRLHFELREFRVSTQKEFFRLSIEEAVNRILSFLSPTELSTSSASSTINESPPTANPAPITHETQRARPENYGANLNEEWDIGARQTLYSRTGKFYMPLKNFPGALCDKNGYVVFKTEADYRAMHPNYLRIGVRLSVPRGISNIPSYHKKR